MVKRLQIRRMGKKEISNKKRILLAAVIVVIAAAVSVFIVQWRRHVREQDQVNKGISYLKNLEEQDTSEINDQIKAVRAEMNIDTADSDDSEIWGHFEDAIILGDSRAVGFSFYEFLPESQVIAQNGEKIINVEQYIDQLKNLNPKRIFLCYGLNDIKSGMWPTAEEYDAAYEDEMKILAKELPDCIVYINSILPAVGSGLESDPVFAEIGEYNESLKAFCEERGYHFIDNTSIAEKYGDLYQEDGLHLQAEFYKYWAANMLAEVEE